MKTFLLVMMVVTSDGKFHQDYVIDYDLSSEDCQSLLLDWPQPENPAVQFYCVTSEEFGR